MPEILDAIRELDPVERAAIIAALDHRRVSAVEAARDAQDQQWPAVAGAGLSRAYGDAEPDYCDADLRP